MHDSDATIYTVALVDPLDQATAIRGCCVGWREPPAAKPYQPRRVDDVPEAFERISRDIRNAYTLAYVPTKSGGDAARRRRTVKVYVRSQDGRVLSVRTRDGYFEKTHEDRQ